MSRRGRYSRRGTIPIAFFFLLVAGIFPAGPYYAGADKAMVTASTPEAVEAGLSILRRGGNAIDAAAAAAFVLMVTDPAMCSLGGRSQILIRLTDGRVFGIDGSTQAPKLAVEPAGAGEGTRTCPVPGSPAALEEMVVRFGTLPLDVVLGPAIRRAEEGFVVNRQYHEYFRKYGASFRRYPGTAKHFLKDDGTFYSEGETIRQPALAATLRIMAAEGTGTLYRGDLARALAADMKASGGLIREEDLAQYRTLPGKILEGEYRGHRILSRGDQCDGGSVIETLHILEHFPPAEIRPSGAPGFHILAQAIYIGQADESLPDWQQTSKALAARRVREIDRTKAWAVPAQPKEVQDGGETTHLSVVDGKDNLVSLTLSIGPAFGSKVVHPDLGFFYAYSYDMNDDPLPYQREKTSQAPTIVLKGDRPVLVLGSAGSSRIPASIVQTIIGVLDDEMTLERAIRAPRVFLAGQELRLETEGLPAALVARLEGLGYVLRSYAELNSYFGRVHGIFIDPMTGRRFGAADPRGYGASGGL